MTEAAYNLTYLNKMCCPTCESADKTEVGYYHSPNGFILEQHICRECNNIFKAYHIKDGVRRPLF